MRRGVLTNRKVAVLGAGSWGTTFAKIVADGGSDVTVWARRPELAREITESKRNSDYLPGINLPRSLTASSRLAEVLDGAEQVFISVPSQTLRDNLAAFRPLIGESAIVVSLMKGVEKGTGNRMSEVIEQELQIGADRIAVASGPNLALEIAKEQPTAAVISSANLQTATEVALTATNPYFRSFVNTDLIGTEFGGVLKNLIATCESSLSRNNTAGRLLGQGYSFSDVIAQMNQTAEGLASVAPILELARAKGVDMPIVQQVGAVLAGTLAPRDIAPHLTTDPMPQGE